MLIKKHFLSFYLICVLATAALTSAEAQTVIGMGTDQPNPNAVLELVPENGNQGFLAPRLSSAQRQASSFTSKLSRADHGLLVFDVDEGKFFYWFKGGWQEGTSGGAEGGNPSASGTTWYTGPTTPSGVGATEGDFYINESTGEVFKFRSSGFVSMGSLKSGSVNDPNLSSVLQQGTSAGNLKITDLGGPTDASDAATKGYVDTELTNVILPTALNPDLKAVLDKGNSADNKKIIGLKNPDNPQDAATKAYVDSEVSNAVTTIQPPPGLETVLGENSNANGRITKLATPVDDDDAVTKGYVDNRDLEDVLNAGNDAGNQQITKLASPTADDHATNRKYVDDQNDVLQKFVEDETRISEVSVIGNSLKIVEGTSSYTVPLSNGGSPASLNEGHLFVGNTSDEPIPVTISGDITIDADGKAIISNARVTAATINADVAGKGLEKNTTTGALDVKVGSGLVIDGGAIRLFNPPAGYLGIGQGLGSNMAFNKVDGDATLDKDGIITVTGILGHPIKNTGLSDGHLLQWQNNQWVLVTIQEIQSDTPEVTIGTSSPSSGSGKAGDIYIMNGKDIYIKVDNSSWVFIKSK